jgi:hypothetical protein
MEREQQERSIKAQRQAAGDAAAMQAWSSLADMDTVTPEAPLAPTHDWQHSADTAAKHAAGVELQSLEGKQRLEQIAATGVQNRLNTITEYATKAKYAPKKTGGGYPIESLTKRIWERHTSPVEDVDQAKRKNQATEGDLAILERYGPAGRQRAADIRQAILTGGNLHDYQGFNRQAFERSRWENQTAKEQADAARRERQAEENRKLQATRALANLKASLGESLDPSVQSDVIEAQGQLGRYSKGGQTATSRANAPATDIGKPSDEQPQGLVQVMVKGKQYLRDPETGDLYEKQR